MGRLDPLGLQETRVAKALRDPQGLLDVLGSQGESALMGRRDIKDFLDLKDRKVESLVCLTAGFVSGLNKTLKSVTV